MPHNPETSSVVAVYRTTVPERVRRRVDRAVSPATRQRIKRGVAFVSARRAMATARSWVHRLLHRGFYSGVGMIRVTVDRRVRVAHRRDGLSSLVARQVNLEWVSSALRGAGIDYFVVPVSTMTGSALGIEASAATAACRALSSLVRDTGGYWNWVVGRSVVSGRVRPGSSSFSYPARRRVDAVRLVWFHTDPTGRIVLGEEHACEVQFWRREHDRLVTTLRNLVTQTIPIAEPAVDVPGEWLTALAAQDQRRLGPVRTRAAFAVKRPDVVRFPIDVVYTWVDGADDRWRQKKAQWSHAAFHADAAAESRYLDQDELRYSLRSLAMYAPWVRQVYLVTDGQCPSWLDSDSPGITLVDHTEIFDDPGALPTFNSHAIESQLHHIDGLSEHFLYLNDDMLFGAAVTPHHFFFANGIAQHFASPATVPPGDPDAADGPVSVAAKNNRALIRDRFGTVPTQKFKHAPYALRRSVLYEIEREFGSQHRATASSRFRDRADLSITSSLHHYYAFETGRSVPGRIRYKYIDLGAPEAARQLGLILAARDQHAFCLNSTTSAGGTVDQEALVSFLDTYYPVPGPHER